MKNVGLYVRVSTQEQADSGWSIEGQVAELYKFCDAHGDWKVRWVLKDPGYSAANLDRPGIQRLLELVQERRVSVVMVWRYDRLSRDNLDFPLLLHIFQKNGVEVASATEPTPGTDTPYGEFAVGMIGLLATLERKMIATRVKMGLRTRARRGLWHGGPVPYGYAYDAGTGRLVPVDAEVEHVRRMFALYAETGRLHATKEVLRREGRLNRHARPWTVTTIRSTLGRRLYTGVLACGGVEVEDPRLALVTRDLFDRCQGLLAVERARNEDDGPADGVVHVHLNKEDRPACPRCGSRQAVRKHGFHLLADGTARRRYWCRLCRSEFRDATADVPIPPCPSCGQRARVQYFGDPRAA